MCCLKNQLSVEMCIAFNTMPRVMREHHIHKCRLSVSADAACPSQTMVCGRARALPSIFVHLCLILE
jgi:hypothetical protein